MVPGSQLLIVERVLLGGEADDRINYLSDIEMMVVLRGQERTPTEFKTLLAPAGFDAQNCQDNDPILGVAAVAL